MARDSHIIVAFLRILRWVIMNTDNRSFLSRPHKRSGDNMDYDRVFEIALGILLALAIG